MRAADSFDLPSRRSASYFFQSFTSLPGISTTP
jgi:hypothetical protein